jgi:C4-dicarboxylate-binding protein DctP
VVTINERLWPSMPTEHRRVVGSAGREAEAAIRERITAIEREAHALAEKNGMKPVELTTADCDLWKYCAAPLLEEYLDRSGPLGDQLMAGYRQLLVEAHRKDLSNLGQVRRH